MKDKVLEVEHNRRLTTSKRDGIF